MDNKNLSTRDTSAVISGNGHNRRRQEVKRSEPIYSCFDLCGRLKPCGNKHCSNYRK